MTTRRIFTFNDAPLTEKCSPITNVDGKVHELINDMIETMYHDAGIGLAAPQIGISSRLVVIDVSEDGEKPFAIINPEIIQSHGQANSDEGCLSIPGYRDSIKRKASVLVRGINPEGEEFEIEASGLLSFCLQHEIDHLDGVLFVDHLSRIKREFFKRWAAKEEIK